MSQHGAGLHWPAVTLCTAGEVAYDHAIVQQAASLVRRLPAVKTSGFQGDYFKVSGRVCLCQDFCCMLKLNSG